MPSDISPEMLFDKRIVERNLRKGLVSQKDVDGNVKALADQAEHAALLEAKIEHTAMSTGAAMSAKNKQEEEDDID